MADTFDYAESQADADELIAEFGQAGTIRRSTRTGPDYDPTITTTDYDCTLVLLDYASRDVDGTLILQTDKRVLVKVGDLDVVPAVADKLILGGQTLSVMNVKPLSPGGTVVLYELQARV